MLIFMTLFYQRHKIVVPFIIKKLKRYQNVLTKNLKDQCVGKNIKKSEKKTEQISLNIFSNQTF